MLTRIHHTGVVVRSIEEAYRSFRDTLGLALLREETIADQGVKAALLHLGNSLLELLEPVEPDTGIARYLERRGEGLHHVCLEAGDIGATLAGLKAKEVELIDEAPRDGLTGTIAFLHPSALHGVLVELVHGPTAMPIDGAPGNGPVRRLDHVVFAVESMEDALAGWARAFGLAPAPPPYEPEATHMELGILPLGDAFLELVRPTTDGHRVARFIAERGEGMFSVSLQVGDLDRAVAELRSKDADVSDPEAGVLPNTRIARIPRASAFGVAVQLIERL